MALPNYEKLKEQKILWRDTEGSLMFAGQTAPLSEKISEQKNGIALLFQPYREYKPQPWGQYVYFLPKIYLKVMGEGNGICLTIPDDEYGVQAGKYLYFYDDRIEGNDHNKNIVTMFGQSIDNKNVVLTAVFGV